MRAYALAIASVALISIPTSGFSQEAPRPRVSPPEEYYYGSGRCEELRKACLHKEELGEEGEGDCRLYREECR